MASNYTLLRAKGLSTFSNPLSQAVSEGSFADVQNVVVDRNEIIEPRRGIAQYGNSFGTASDRSKQLINYKDTVIRHVLNRLEFDLDSLFTQFTGPSVNEIRTGLRIKSIEANGNLYFVSSTGIKKISARNSADFPDVEIQEAGGPKALDLLAFPDYSTPGFLTKNSKVAYAIVWGTRDINDNLILGAPSSRTVVFNRSVNDSCTVELTFSIPEEIQTTNYFYQVYRTGVFASEVMSVEPPDPGNEMYLVFEETVSDAEILAGEVEVQDITPEDFRKSGTLLYTNPVSGGGIASANEKPPFATDIALYKQYTFYANTKTVQRFSLAFLSVQAMVTNVSNFIISDGTTTNTYLFRGSIESYNLDFTGMIAADFYNASPAEAKYFTLTSANDETQYIVYYKQSADDETPVAVGKLGIEVEILSGDTLAQIIQKTVDAIYEVSDDFNISIAGDELLVACSNNGAVTIVPTETLPPAFTIVKDGLGTGEDAAAKKIFLPRVPTSGEAGPTPAQQLEQVARSLINVLNEEDDIVYAYYFSGYNDVPGQLVLEQRNIVGPQFYLNSNVGSQFTPTLPLTGATIVSNNEVKPNRIYYSKYQQPEAVPLTNYIDIGPKDREIKRIIALRDSLFIFKEDGIYRLSGESDPFVVAEFDFSTQVLAPDTAVVLNNQIYALSTLGVIVVTDTGVEVISRQIENSLLNLTRNGFSYKTTAFGLSYESDKAYILWMPTTMNDTVATQAFRYNTFTGAWTRWVVTHTCGIVNFADDTMYLGAGDINYIEKERKSLTRMDHADREYVLSILNDGVSGNTVKVNDISKVEINDVVIQTQYLSKEQYNRVLIKLDMDQGVDETDYLSELEMVVGENMRAKIIELATKLDADTGVDYTDFVSDIGNYTITVTDVDYLDGNTILTTATVHNILEGRFLITNANDFAYEVLEATPTEITIEGTLLGSPTVAQTDVNNYQDIQACFNIIIDELNADTNVFYSNYPRSVGFMNLESPIIGIDKTLSALILKHEMGYMLGDISLFKAIKTKVVWNPIYFQDPSLTKQVREGTMIFENSNFSAVTVSYASDLSPSFEPTDFSGEGLGVGDWGYFNWGTINWGGIAAPIPLRTTLPVDKQRCRFINVMFEHGVAFEKYAIYGLSLTYRMISTRGYK